MLPSCKFLQKKDRGVIRSSIRYGFPDGGRGVNELSLLDIQEPLALVLGSQA
jgi:hypothetical protein